MNLTRATLGTERRRIAIVDRETGNVIRESDITGFSTLAVATLLNTLRVEAGDNTFIRCAEHFEEHQP
jgi:hypothetical protein